MLEGARAFLKRGRQSRSADGGGRRSRSSDRRGITRPADDSRRTGTPRASRNAVALNNDRGQSPPLCRKGRVQRDQAQDAREVRTCGPAGRPSPGAITDGRSGRPSPRLQGGARAARSSPASLAIVGHSGDRGGKGRWPGLATLGRAKGGKSPPISCTGVAASRGRNGGCRRRHASSVHRSIR